MSQPTHPSPELLSGFFDQELSPDERTPIASHLESCTGCRETMESFSVLSELGPVVEESLPGQAYWLDLPDRVLARIHAGDDAGARAVPVGDKPSFWRRIFQPAGGLQWAGATGLAAVLVVGVWMVLQAQTGSLSPADDVIADAAATRTVPPLSAGDPVPGPNTMNPDDFARRVVLTLGGPSSLGTSLDLRPGEAVSNPGHSGIGQQVTQSLPPLGLKARAEADPVVSYGCGINPLEQAFIAALKAEETGDLKLAMQGYEVVRANLEPTQPLYCEADYRLTYLQWKQRLTEEAGTDRARTLASLHSLANQSFQVWQQTQDDMDCTKAWCMNRVLLTLTEEALGRPEVDPNSSRMLELNRCASTTN